MLLDYTIASEEMRSWSVQYKWKICDSQNQEIPEELLKSLHLADKEEQQEEEDKRWYLPVVKKKVRKNGKWKEINEFHEPGIDLSEVGLRGSLKPADFG